MTTTQLFIPFLLILLSFQSKPIHNEDIRVRVPEKICLSPFEAALYEKLIKYRAEHNLPSIALSHSLTLVAQVHCRDLAINKPHIVKNCNMHSWSRKGSWTSCCYTPNHKKASCMWNKPRELTTYTDDGFEIAFFSTASYPNAFVFAEDAIKSWSESKGHHDVIINQGIWKTVKWKAVGVGHYGEYATIWFGMKDDSNAVTVGLCE